MVSLRSRDTAASEAVKKVADSSANGKTSASPQVQQSSPRNKPKDGEKGQTIDFEEVKDQLDPVVLVSEGRQKSPSLPKTTDRSGLEEFNDRGICVCNGSNDGRPMILCEGGCNNWFHFDCIELSEDDAGDIEFYYCPSCEKATGVTTSKDYEGHLTGLASHPSTPAQRKSKPRQPKGPTRIEDIGVSSDDDDDGGSGDDYVEESMHKRKRSGKRASRRMSTSDGTEEEDEPTRRQASAKRIKKTPSNPVPTSNFYAVNQPNAQPGPSKHKSTREFCLGKLREMLKDIFLEYSDDPETNKDEDAAEGGETSGDGAKAEGNVNADEKAKAFATELENCMMETYAEPDKTGRPAAAKKYSQRFRTLSFNITQRNRVALRKGIASGVITPAQINVMSSNELADERLRHNIELAEKEALEHSILQKITAPRAKITHKGLETIEDVSGQRTLDREEEERMERERRERERSARMKAAARRDDSPATPVAPSPMSATFHNRNSPVVSGSPAVHWHGSPDPQVNPVQHVQNNDAVASSSARTVVRPLFVPTMSNDFEQTPEQGLSLSDLIHIDDDGLDNKQPTTSPNNDEGRQNSVDTEQTAFAGPSGPSPFAPAGSAEPSEGTTFNLNSIWSNREDSGVEPHTEDEEMHEASDKGDEHEKYDHEEGMDLGSDGGRDDALDAILSGAVASSAGVADAAVPQPVPAGLDALPTVWTGEIVMPVEKSDAVQFEVSCKQIGGHELGAGAHPWNILFPSSQARVDGRVQPGNSNPYLVKTRLNAHKELIAVCFTPASDSAKPKYNEFVQFFIEKDRHALCFPWGTHPGPAAPGRELYIIPLLKDQPIPEFVELMDNLSLPKERAEDTLLGVFVLIKGKLESSVTPPLQSSLKGTPVPPPLPGFGSAPPLGGHAPTNAPYGAAPGKVDQAALAAEIASLTQEQVSLMLRHLSQNVALPNPSQPASMSIPTTGNPFVPPAIGTALPPPMPPFPPRFPDDRQSSQYQPESVPSRGYNSPPRVHDQYDRSYDDYDDYGGGHQKQFTGERGRGRGKSRRSGRGRNNRGDHGPGRGRDAPSGDAGWGGRGRGRARY